MQRFYICPDVPVNIIRVIFNFRFSSRNSQNQQKLAKKITHFAIQFRSKNLTCFTNLNSLDIENNIHPQHSQKISDFTHFPANMFLFGVRKKYLHCTISRRPRTALLKHFESRCLYISIYLIKKIFVRETL